MHTMTRLSALALAALLVSTSLAGAAPNGPLNLPILNVPQQPIVNIPINNNNNNNDPQLPNPPIFKFPQKPNIPIIPIFNKPGPTQPDQPNQAGPSHTLPSVDCKVSSPLGVTDDIWIINTGDVVLPSGVQINFRVSSSGDHGAFLLPRSLGVGEKIRIRNLLHDAESGAPCTVKLMV